MLACRSRRVFFLASILIWTSLFLVGNGIEFGFGRKRPTYDTIANRVLTLLHAAFAIGFGLTAIVLRFNIGEVNTPFQTKVIAFSLAFFVVDFGVMIGLRYKRRDFYFHHLMCFFVEGYGLLAGTSGWEICSSIAFGEMGPCFYLGLLARRLEIRSPRFYWWNDHAYLAAFLFSRWAAIPVLVYLTLRSPVTAPYIKVFALVFLILGLYWGIALLKRHYKKYGVRAAIPLRSQEGSLDGKLHQRPAHSAST